MIQETINNQFLIKKDITFLNFGSFGAAVKPVFKAYQDYQLELEQDPVHFMTHIGMQYLKESRIALANYIGCHDNDVVYVTNPSYAVNIVAKSFPLKQGDEVLTTNLEYGACDKTWKYYCNKVGAKYIQQPITLPVTTKAFFVEEFFKGVTANTKLIFISHITSSTGLRLPVEEIVAKAKSLGIATFIDGAHAPGQVPLNMQELGVDMYTGACHKWMMTAKGSSFLYIKKEIQHLFDPLVVSWGYDALFPSDSQFLDYHQTQGTRDFTAFLTIPTAINFMQENNWWNVAEDCRNFVLQQAPRFLELLQAKSIAPLNHDFLVQLFSIPINCKEPEKLHDYLYSKYQIQIPVMRHGNQVYLRYSVQVFNTVQDFDNLLNALKDILETTNFIEV